MFIYERKKKEPPPLPEIINEDNKFNGRKKNTVIIDRQSSHHFYADSILETTVLKNLATRMAKERITFSLIQKMMMGGGRQEKSERISIQSEGGVEGRRPLP